MMNLQVKQLSKKFEQFALKDVSFQIKAGEVMGFIGENGAGKTSTIHCILQLLQQDEGEVYVLGERFHADSISLKQQIGVVYDKLHFPTSMPMQQLEKMYATLYPRWDQAYFEQLLERLKVPRNVPIAKMSAGMQKKLSIALALAYSPKLLLLDEPTSQLDAVIRDEILTILMEYMAHGDRSILFSSHITSDIEKIATSITLIYNGQIAFTRGKEELQYTFRTFKGSIEQAAQIPAKAIYGKRDSVFGVELLVKRELVSPTVPLMKADLEDIVIFLSRSIKQRQLMNEVQSNG